MFKIISQFLILIYMIIVVYTMVNLQKFNINGFIIETNNSLQIKENYQKLNPTYTRKNIHFDINNSDYDYLQDINNYKMKHPSFVFQNKELFDRIVTGEMIFDANIFDDSHYYFPNYQSLSIISGYNSIPLKKCFHNHNIIGVLEGESIIYLFNPKHKDEIINKENNEIKKWGHKKIIQKGDIILIPPYWSYIQEINEGTIQYHIDIDTYFTFIPNFFKSS